ncbi:hypothetical protein, partial [Stenotrophomonas maltophilia group sp. RNC7]|uniref:hypothetical protein n=1 Tax=Stenotrophomonas maltophilia group sp. RNC7 TaxID=3071467 RepID=UPI0027E157BC
TKIAEETIYLDGIEVELRKKLNLLEEKWKQRETVVKEFQEKYNNFVGELTELEKINELAIKELKIFNFLEGEIGKHLTKVYAFLAKDKIRELKIKESELKGELEKAEKDLADEKRFLNIELAALNVL